MKTRRNIFIVFAFAAFLILLVTVLTWAEGNPLNHSSPNTPVGTGFTYQGYLKDSGSPADGSYDFLFDLYDADGGGSSVGSNSLDDVLVENGIFTVILDFGAAAFEGDERWLAVSVRPGSETGAYTPLAERQLISPTPYALYAIEAGQVEWTDILSRPAGLDDGDNDTTYSPGFGLFLDSTTFNVSTNQVQSTVWGDCTVGSTIQEINFDGSVVCEPHDSKSTFSISTIITLVDQSQTSITIGTDGLPVISYYQDYYDNLEFIHCDNPICDDWTSVTLDYDGNMGSHNSIAVGSDGAPVISYYDANNGFLKVAHCDDAACSSFSLNEVDTEADVGPFTSIAVGPEGLPVISYYDRSNTALKVAYCHELDCSSAEINTIDPDAHGVNSIAVGADGLPIIAYMDDYLNLKVAHCDNLICDSFTITNYDTSDSDGNWPSITIGIDGLPVISYYNMDPGDLEVAHCSNRECTSSTVATVDASGDVGYYTSITIGSDGMPVISYFDADYSDLKVAHCDDTACTNASSITVDAAGDVGIYSAITIGMDGMPIISYIDSGSPYLKVLHCSNTFCVPYWTRR